MDKNGIQTKPQILLVCQHEQMIEGVVYCFPLTLRMGLIFQAKKVFNYQKSQPKICWASVPNLAPSTQSCECTLGDFLGMQSSAPSSPDFETAPDWAFGVLDTIYIQE